MFSYSFHPGMFKDVPKQVITNFILLKIHAGKYGKYFDWNVNKIAMRINKHGKKISNPTLKNILEELYQYDLIWEHQNKNGTTKDLMLRSFKVLNVLF